MSEPSNMPYFINVVLSMIEEENIFGHMRATIIKATALLHRDPRIWQDHEEFLPERFLTSHANIDASGQHFEFTPFGSDRRSCPGHAFAFQVSHLTLARLLLGFESATLGGMPVDMTEGLGISLPRATPLEVLLTSRLLSKLYKC
ncbi:Cytochrome P450 82C2 [Morella rubra]|uniref:Cytochrome P450 82C2 n=1 Tax=Morella rubra TaxID=262757 RepID=A0A6A1UL53_9ROSI|nr:Cytochrome P450 82C2 [Morella rubra]